MTIVEPFEVDIMERPPRASSEGVLTIVSSSVIVCQGLILSMITLGVYILSQSDGRLISTSTAFLSSAHPTVADQRSLSFLVLTSMQLVQSFLSRSVTASVFKTGLTGNKWMSYAFFLSFGLLLAGFYIPSITFLI